MASQPPTGPYDEEYNRQWQPYDISHGQQQPQQQQQPYTDASPPPPPTHRNHPAAHPSSSFNALQSQRQYGLPQPPSPTRSSPPRAIVSQRHSFGARSLAPPQPEPQYMQGSVPTYQDTGIAQRQPYDQRHSYTSPEVRPVGGAAAGGAVAGAAYGMTENHPGPGDMRALRDIDNLYGPGHMGQPDPVSRDATPYEDAWETPYHGTPQRQPIYSRDSASSMLPLAGAAQAPGRATPPAFQSTNSVQAQDAAYMGRQLNGHNGPGHVGADAPPPPPVHQRQSWYDNPYDSFSTSRQPTGFNDIDPNSIADDGDDGLEYHGQQAKRKTVLGFGRNGDSKTSLGPAAAVGAAGAGAGAGVAAAAAAGSHSQGGGFFGGRDASGTYTSVPGGAAPGTAGPIDPLDMGEEKNHSEWLASQTSGNKRLKWIVGTIIVIVIIAAVVGGVVGGVLASRNSDNGGGGGGGGGMSAAKDDGNGLLTKDSQEIQALLNNKDLHRVFPGVDYTPIHSQYPECLTNPPSQNNVTRDMAVLSQLTNTLRLYGTDCNQTEMALSAIETLGLTDMKLWLGVWLGNNDTTNARQVATAWEILDKHGADPFAGVAVGNEVLFREDLTAAQLATYLSGFKANLTAKNLDLPVSTSDLGSNWDAQLASEVDVVMANVHPFFAGVEVGVAAAWTWSFWQANDVAVSNVAAGQRNIISEVGWPSGGGNDCGPERECTSSSDGSVAGVDEMNKFMADWVCQALNNGTEYFWFEAFDEPWKSVFNEPDKGQNWEDKWGLMDVNRNLKDGVKIPDCGGKTVKRR